MATRAALIAGVLCCLGWAVNADNELPRIILGTYQDNPSQAENYDQFANLFDLPVNVTLHKLRQLEFRKEGDQYYQSFIFWPERTVIDVPFQLNKKVPYPVPGRGKTIECLYTVEEDADKKQATLKVQFQHVEGNMKYSVDAVFDKKGMHSRLTRDGVEAKRTYRRIVPAYAIGTFEVDPASMTPEVKAFYQSLAPLPPGIEFGNVSFYFGPKWNSDYFLDQLIFHPTYWITTEFKFFEKFSVKIGNYTVQREYTIEESGADTTKVVLTEFSSRANGKWTTIFHRNGSGVGSSSFEGGDTEFSIRFNRVIPWGLLGRFEEDPSYPNATDRRDRKHMDKLEVIRKGRQYILKEQVGSREKAEFSCELTGNEQSRLIGGNVVKYNVSVEFGPWYILHVTGEKFTSSLMITPPGLIRISSGDNYHGVLRTGYVRIVSPAIFGVFQSDQYGEDFKNFLQAIGYPEPQSPKISIEFRKGNDRRHHLFKLMMENDKSQEIPFVLGLPSNVSVAGIQQQNSFIYFEHKQEIPAIRHFIRNSTAKGAANCYVATGMFNPDGVDVTYVYGGENCLGMDKIARRTFKRQGPSVPLAEHST